MDFLILSHHHLAKHFAFYHDSSLYLVGRRFPVESDRWIVQCIDMANQLNFGLDQNAYNPVLCTLQLLDFLNQPWPGHPMTGSWPDVFESDDPVVLGAVDQEHGCQSDCSATRVRIVERPVGFRNVAIDIAQERKWKIEPLPKLFVDLWSVIGCCHKLHAEATYLPVGLTQLRQVQSSGGSPMSAIQVQHNRAAPGESAKGGAVAIFVFQFEEWRGLPEQRLSPWHFGWSPQERSDTSQFDLRTYCRHLDGRQPVFDSPSGESLPSTITAIAATGCVQPPAPEGLVRRREWRGPALHGLPLHDP